MANACFYGGRLKHGCSPEQRVPLLPGLPPLLWLDAMGQEQGTAGRGRGSLCNPQEATAIARLLRAVVQEGGVAPDRCGVIACYRRQVSCVQQTLEGGGGGSGPAPAVQIATVDSFQVFNSVAQGTAHDILPAHYIACRLYVVCSCVSLKRCVIPQGQERDLIVLSTTATRPGSSAAFVSDSQRLNVALTRARCHLVIVGAASVMQRAAAAFDHVLRWCRCAAG